MRVDLTSIIQKNVSGHSPIYRSGYLVTTATTSTADDTYAVWITKKSTF